MESGGWSVSLSALDNSTIYLNGSGKVAIKPLGITDGLVAGASTILRGFVSTVSYTPGQLALH